MNFLFKDLGYSGFPFCEHKAGPLYRALQISAQCKFRASFKDQKYWFEAAAATALTGDTPPLGNRNK